MNCCGCTPVTSVHNCVGTVLILKKKKGKRKEKREKGDSEVYNEIPKPKNRKIAFEHKKTFSELL